MFIEQSLLSYGPEFGNFRWNMLWQNLDLFPIPLSGKIYSHFSRAC